jgi:hypothetical protein
MVAAYRGDPRGSSFRRMRGRGTADRRWSMGATRNWLRLAGKAAFGSGKGPDVDTANILAHLPLKGIDFVLIAAIGLWLWPRLPASEGLIKRRLARIRDEDVRREARARLIAGSLFDGPRYTNSNDLITRRGLNLAIQHAEIVVRRERKLAPKQDAQKRGILDL